VKLRISKSLEACSIPLGSLSELFDLAVLLSAAVDILDGLWCLSNDNIYNYVVNIDIALLLQRHRCGQPYEIESYDILRIM
jgi:hypothetical protein